MEQMVVHRDLAELDSHLDHVCQAPRDEGTVELIVCRPAVDERAVLDEGTLDLTSGLVGDTWLTRGNTHTPDGLADPVAQLTLTNVRATAAVAVTPERSQLAGDQLYLDIDLSIDNLPPGTRLALGDAVVEISEKPHTGCAKFSARFGNDAMRWVNSPVGRQLRLRGANARVIVPGTVRRGDPVRKLAPS